MEFNLSTPALLFSAISLFMMAHTNRFIALANLIRQYVVLYKEKKEPRVIQQIKNFRRRLNVIKFSQISAVISFLLCVVSMFLIFIFKQIYAEITFALSLLFLFVSLILSLYELSLSIGALKIEMEELSMPSNVENAKPL